MTGFGERERDVYCILAEGGMGRDLAGFFDAIGPFGRESIAVSLSGRKERRKVVIAFLK